MAKNITDDITALGFIANMFNKNNETDFIAMLNEVIAEQAVIFEGRVGSTVYASATSPTLSYVKRGEKCLIAAELIQRRINVLLGNVTGVGREIDISHEAAQKKAYKDEADMWVTKLTAGETSDTGDFSSGVLVTSHFESSGLSGEEIL